MEKDRGPTRMRCLEVWGGNVRVSKHFVMPGLDVWVSSQPQGQAAAGGDVYYLSSCAAGRITRILLADVSGHGELVATTAGALRDLMRRNINVVSQRRFMADMNRQFAGVGDEDDYATAVVSSFDAPTRALSLCNAGHPNPLIFRAAQGRWSLVDLPPPPSDSAENPTDLPLGMIDRVGYRELNLRLEKGDRVLCYTDAFSESLRPGGEMLGVEGVLQIVASLNHGGDEGLVASLVDAVRTLHPENLAQDDATLVLFCANGARYPILDEALAVFRMLGRAADSTHIAQCAVR